VAIPLDEITLKKLILVKQLYNRALLQAEAHHSPVDRIMAVICFDLTHETILKAVAGALTSKPVKDNFPDVLQQADSLLADNNLSEVPDKAKILFVRSIRNDAQHKAKYPNPTDVSDCRTYSRDFLRQIMPNVWDKSFESLSLVDAIQHSRIREYLREAETELTNGNHTKSVINTVAGFEWAISNTKAAIVGRIPSRADTIFVGDGSGRPRESREMFRVFAHMRDTVMRSVIGLNFPGYLKFTRITDSFHIFFYGDGHYDSTMSGPAPNPQEAEYVLEFATNAILQIESLVGDIEKPFQV
jgi:hypothetical protein